MLLHWPSPGEILGALLVLFVVGAHVAALGYWMIRALGYRGRTPLVGVVATAALGLVMLELFVLAVGHARIGGLTFLNSTTFTVTGVVAAVSIMPAAMRLRGIAQEARALVGRLGFEWVLVNSMVILFVFAALSGMRGSMYEDDYKPGAPLVWAQAGRFVATDYRICNGMAATEAIYAVPQTYYRLIGVRAALIALHWTHLLIWVLTALAAGALAESFGAAAVAVAAAVVAIPGMASTAATAGTDIPCAAMLTASLAVLFAERRGEEDDVPFSRAALLLAGILLGGAITSKPILIVGSAPIALFVFVEYWRSAKKANVIGGLCQVLLVAAPAIVIVLMWIAHTYSMTGKIWDGSGQLIVSSSHDPLWADGEAAGRWPSFLDLVKLPAVPFYIALLGQHEPYGGRIGVLTMSLSLVGIYMLWRMPPAQRRLGYWALGSALLYFFLLGPFAIKTRFHDFVWIIFASLAALAYTQARGTENRQRPWWHVVYWLVAAGIVYYIVRVEYYAVTGSQRQAWGAIMAITAAVAVLVAAHVRGRAKGPVRVPWWQLAVCGAFIFLAVVGILDSIARKLILPG